MQRRHLLAAVAGSTVMPAHAQVLPAGRPLHLVVPFPPGGQGDTLTRFYAEALTAETAQPVVIDNRPGANGVLGVQAVARAAPDGATLGVFNVSLFTALPLMMDRPPYDPWRDLLPIMRLATSTLVCVVTAERARQRGWHDFRALIEWAKQPGHQLTKGSSGNGSLAQLLIGVIAKRTGAAILHVPYRGGAPAATDLLAGTIDMVFDYMPAVLPHLQSGSLIALAVGSNARSPILPDVPGMAEFADLNLGDIDMQSWNALTGPPGMPPETVRALFEGFRRAAAWPPLAQRLRASGLLVSVSDSPTAVHDQLRQEAPRWREMVELSGARMD